MSLIAFFLTVQEAIGSVELDELSVLGCFVKRRGLGFGLAERQNGRDNINSSGCNESDVQPHFYS